MGGAPRAPPSRYWSALSTWFEIMSSPLVTFNFKMFPKHRLTQISNFLAQIRETRGQRQVVSIDFDKKIEKIWFFQFFFKQIIYFCLKLNSMWKMRFFEVLHVEIAQKLQILKISLIFSNFPVNIWFSLIFHRIIKQNFWKRIKLIGINATFQGTWFLSWILLQGLDS